MSLFTAQTFGAVTCEGPAEGDAVVGAMLCAACVMALHLSSALWSLAVAGQCSGSCTPRSCQSWSGSCAMKCDNSAVLLYAYAKSAMLAMPSSKRDCCSACGTCRPESNLQNASDSRKHGCNFVASSMRMQARHRSASSVGILASQCMQTQWLLLTRKILARSFLCFPFLHMSCLGPLSPALLRSARRQRLRAPPCAAPNQASIHVSECMKPQPQPGLTHSPQRNCPREKRPACLLRTCPVIEPCFVFALTQLYMLHMQSLHCRQVPPPDDEGGSQVRESHQNHRQISQTKIRRASSAALWQARFEVSVQKAGKECLM